MKESEEKAVKEKEPIPRVCAYCQNARVLATKKTEAPPLLILLTDTLNGEDTVLLCPYKKNPSPDYKCRRFRFDPLKYRPKQMPTPFLLSADDVL